MFGKKLLLTLAALIPFVIPGLQNSATGFELFPRPKGQYTVQRGDTLYGIASYYYTNPALWPFLWNQNPSILIKGGGGTPEHQPLTPGSLVNLYGMRTDNPVMVEPYRAPVGVPDDMRYIVTEIPFQGIPYHKRMFRYKLSMRPTRLWGYIASCPDITRTHFVDRDLVYIRFRPSKKQAILVGDRFGIYRDRGPVFHPLNPERPIGYVSEIIGEVEITSTGHEMVTGIILDFFEEVIVGDKICLFTPRSKEIVPTKTHRLMVGTILRSATTNTNFTNTNNVENEVVFVDRGECDGMKEGTLFNIYRTTHPISDPYFNNRRITVPDRYVGEGMVLKTFDKSSTLLITTSLEEIQPGDVIKSVSD